MTCCFTATGSPPARPLPAPPQGPYNALPAATKRVVLSARNWKQIAPKPEPNPPRSFFEAIAAAGSDPNPCASLSHHMFSRGALLSYGFLPPDVEEYMNLQLPEDVNGTPEEKSRFWETYQRHWLSTRWIRQEI